MVKFFSDPTEEPEYRAWLTKNADSGYVANRWADGAVVMLHHANCRTLTANRYRKTTPQYQKRCGCSLPELRSVIKKKWDPEEFRECSWCWKTDRK